jgi:alcohol dehydrogenase (cytochrome c)
MRSEEPPHKPEAGDDSVHSQRTVAGRFRTARTRYAWAAVGFLVLVIVIAVCSVAPVRWRLAVVRLKATGSLPDLGWVDLFWMSRPGGNHFNLDELANTPNPYIVIRSPYSSAADISAGEGIFQSHCTICHGANGSEGLSGPTLQQRQMVRGSSDWAIFRTISFGMRGTAMPGSTLPELDRWRLVAYVRSLMLGSKPAANSTPVARIPVPKPVSYEEILSADQRPDRWLSYSGSYDSHRFSPLHEITTANVAGLRLLWMRQYSISEGTIETSPLVAGNYMFVTVPPNRVEALNARTGDLIWAYDRNLPEHLSLCCGYANRGLAILGDTLFFGTLDAHLVALDISTGQVRWDVEIADNKDGYSITAAPLVLKDMVITGVAGGEFGIRGFVDARDAATGREIWRFQTIPQPGQPGGDTWEGNAWKTGGGPTWITGSFDPETNLLYWPIGNPSPNIAGDARRGDNLYTNSVVALDADHGTLRWYFQFTPHDVFDWDATENLVLFDGNIEGKRQRLLAQANRNGFYYLLDRDTGRFLLARQFAKQTWAQGIDSRGRPIANPTAHPTRQGTAVYPGIAGGANWQSPSYSPVTGFIYVPFLDRGGIFYTTGERGDLRYHPGELFEGGFFQLFSDRDHHPEAAVRALNAVTGEQKWEYRNPASQIGGLLSTGGGVVFGSQDQYFFALDASTGHELWRVSTGGRILAAPITFLCEGKQIVTIAAGQDILTFGR